MTDVNKAVDGINDRIVGTGLSMNEISNGLGVGVTAGLDVSRKFSAGLGYEQLSASTSTGDRMVTFMYKFTANAFRAFGEYKLQEQGRLGLHVGLGAGLVSEFGLIEVAGLSARDLTGTGPLVDASVGTDWWFKPQLALTGSAGYRHARVSELKLAGRTFRNFDGSKIAADYSGVLVRLGFKLAWTR
jgi:hypothetical protein